MTALSHFFNKPTDRPAYIYDAQASNKLSSKDTIPDAWAAIFPWVVFFVTVVLVEFAVSHSCSLLSNVVTDCPVVSTCYSCCSYQAICRYHHGDNLSSAMDPAFSAW